MSVVLKLENVCKKYDGFELKNVSFTLEGGTIMGFVGANASGKTTTIKLILNMIKRSSGTIEIFGRDNIAHEFDVKQEIGTVLDGAFFYDQVNAKKIEKVLSTMYSTWDSELFASYMKRFQLPFDKKLKEMSRGMQMKLYLATVLARRPRLLLLDEATSGLDPLVRDEILDILRDIVEDEGCAILISSHITSDLDKVADIITMIDGGEILLSEGKDDLLDRHAIWKGSVESFMQIPSEAVISHREGSFGVEALVLRGVGIDEASCLRPSVEDIMINYTRRAQ